MSKPDHLELPDGRCLAYHRVEAADRSNTVGVVFLGGLRSDMTGTKAVSLEEWARRTGRAYLRFDYTGHGQSSGQFADGCIGEWRDDAHDAIRHLTTGPQILVGSSMGGWVALLLALDSAIEVAGLIGIAAAPDFTEALLPALSPQLRATLLEEGRVSVESEYDDPYVFTSRLIADGAHNLVLEKPLTLNVPVRLLHGTEDRDVPISTALRILEQMAEGSDARLHLLKGEGHRMSSPAALEMLEATIEDMLSRSGTS